MPQPEKYPWEKWFGWKSFKLTRGKHFEGLPHSMAQTIRNRAPDYGKKVSISIGETTLEVKVRDE